MQKEPASARGSMLRPSFIGRHGTMASGSASTSSLDGNGSGRTVILFFPRPPLPRRPSDQMTRLSASERLSSYSWHKAMPCSRHTPRYCAKSIRNNASAMLRGEQN